MGAQGCYGSARAQVRAETCLATPVEDLTAPRLQRRPVGVTHTPPLSIYTAPGIVAGATTWPPQKACVASRRSLAYSLVPAYGLMTGFAFRAAFPPRSCLS